MYVIRDPGRQVVHVGRTPRAKGGLHQRLYDHLAGRSSFVADYLKGKEWKLRGGFTFQYLEVPDHRQRVLLEYHATVVHCPKHLGDGSKTLVVGVAKKHL